MSQVEILEVGGLTLEFNIVPLQFVVLRRFILRVVTALHLAVLTWFHFGL